SRKGEHQSIFEDARKAGFVRVRVNGHIRDLSEDFDLDKKKKHTIEVVVDRLVVGEGEEGEASRIADSVETSLKLGSGVVLISVLGGEETLYSEHFACIQCGISLGEIEPRTFSFNSPHGACPTCTGLGAKMEIDPDLVIPNKNLSLSEGAIQPWVRSGVMSTWYNSMVESVARSYGFSTRVPVKSLREEDLNILLYGTNTDSMVMSHRDRHGKVWEWDTRFEGIVHNLERRYRETESDYTKREIERYMMSRPCAACNGKRLKPESLAVTVGGINIMEMTAMSIAEALDWVTELSGAGPSRNGIKEPLTDRERTIARQILKEIQSRLTFLKGIGLDYLTLDRAAGTLSGGEAQRIRLATQIGSGLMGVLYVCDEPSVGLHPADDYRLIDTLKRLRDLGNTILIVEHDEAIMRAADHIVDLGPGAGDHGGWVVVEGTVEDIIQCEESITGRYLGGFKEIPLPQKRRASTDSSLVVKGARENNLKSIDVEFPLGIFVCVTGVSGSGKSSLVNEIVYKRLAQYYYKAKDRPGQHDGIVGIENIDKVVNIDQSPIGRTPRSNPATYTGTFTPIRELFTTVPEARMRGYKPGRFSFNVKGGRCEACQGEGYNQIEMQFLPDVTVPCEVCKGKRYGREALEILFKGKNIAEVLDMTVEEASAFFEHFPKVFSKLKTMRDVGLGYIKLGQPATTLSGGEAQRVKLSTELSRRATGRTLYILDEPTTGLSFEDANALLRVLHRLVDAGNTVVLIEHHLDLIKSADYIIDLGPGAGDAGGYVVATGTPEEVAKVKGSFTGQYLKPLLAKHKAARARS
ncbi:MAG: excinuclease ABC subunit UvrA, partial [Dehalococcoidia bacterium]